MRIHELCGRVLVVALASVIVTSSCFAVLGRHNSAKGDYGTGTEIFTSTPVTFTLSDGSQFTLESRIRCVTGGQNCFNANAVFVYFYVITIPSGGQAVTQPITLQLTAPFDPHNSPSLSFGILDRLDAQSFGTMLADCPGDMATCIDPVLDASSTADATGKVTFVLNPPLASHSFKPGDQIFVYATSFSPPNCSFDYTAVSGNIVGLSCNSSSLTTQMNVSATGSVSPTSMQVLAPVLSGPQRRMLAPDKSVYFFFPSSFAGNTINAQTTKASTTTQIPGFLTSSVDVSGCQGCAFDTGGHTILNVSYGYLYNLTIPSTLDVTVLPKTLTATVSAPFNQDNFEFLSFGVLGTSTNVSSGLGSGASLVANCITGSPTTPAVYDACVDTVLTNVVQQPQVLAGVPRPATALTFTIDTSKLSAGDNLVLFATSNNKPNTCSTSTGTCASTTPIALSGDASATLSFATGSPTTVVGPSEALPLPSITSLSPNSALQSSGAFALAVNGSNFVVGAQVLWNGSPRPTTYLSSTQVTAAIPAPDLLTSGPVPVTISNPPNPSVGPNPEISSAVSFTVVTPNPVPAITSFSPASAIVGAAPFTLTINGTGFVPSSTATFNGSQKTTTFVSATSVTIPLTAADVATAGSFPVVVTNAAPGGGASNALNFLVNPAPTVTALSSNANPSAFGSAVTFTATVTSSATGTPTGTVTFKDGATTLGTGTLNGSAKATFSTSALTVGTHSITAVYGGDASFTTSTSVALTQTVNAASTTTAVASPLNPSVFGQSVTFMATVTSGVTGTPTGTVTFKDGATTLGTGTLNASAVATFGTSALTGGTHSITAVYGGDTNFATSTSTALTQTVNPASTTTALTSSANPSVFGSSVTFTATVTSTAGTPTGTVTFKDGATTLGTGTLNASAVATFSTSALAGGTHSITTAYGSSASFAASTSAALTQTTNTAATTTAVASLLNPSLFGQSVTFTATVTSGAAGTPTGAVAFKDGATTLGTGTLNGSALATFSTSALAGGTHSITVVYAGDTNFATSTSTALAQTVNPAGTSTAVTSSANPSGAGQSVTFTATVTSTATGTPTGTVTFKDGATTLGTGALNASGVAALTTSTLAAGSHSITAVYGGDTNFATSTSPVFTQSVRGPTTTALSSSLNPSGIGQAVTFTATVTSTAAGTPTGNITFKDGATALGTATLNASAVATFSTTTLTGGSHSITAAYGGDANFGVSTSNTVTQVVNMDVTATTVTSSANPSVFGIPVTFTATVTSTAPSMPTGSVTFMDGTTSLGTGNLNASAMATLTTSSVAGGTHSITAVYGGDATFATSTSAALTQTVNPAATSTTLTSSPNPSAFGQSVTFTAIVAPGGAGTVTFKDGTTTLGTGTLQSTIPGPSAAFTTSTLTAGTHSITALYNGDTNHLTSTSAPVTQTVNKATSNTVVTSSLSPSVFGNSVTLTATVTSTAGTPTNTVTFKDGASALGTGALNASGVATFATTALTAGSHSITAVYGGDTNFNGSTSTALTQTVKGATTTALTSSAATANVGASVTFTATVASTAAGTPTGNVTFTDGTTPLGSAAALNGSGVAAFTTTTLGAGPHSITAVYAGDANFGGSTSTALTETINAPDFSVTATPASQTIKAGQLGMVTFTVTPLFGSKQTVTFSCTGLPAHSMCSFVPPSVTLDGTNNGTSTGTIQTTMNSGVPLLPEEPPQPRVPYPPLTLVALAGLAALLAAASRSPRSNARRLAAFAALLIGVTLGLAACSGGSSSTVSNGTPPGSYNISISASANGGATHSAAVTMVVQ